MIQSASPPGDHVLVIGGGVIGAMSAWSLVRAGFRVTVLDRDAFGAACSHGNCGYVCPSHVLPLCQPGAIKKTLRGMLRRNSAFAVRPRLSLAQARWFLGFMGACNERDMMTTAHDLHGLLQSSLRGYRELLAETGIDCDWQEKGLLYIHDDARAFEAFGETEGMLRERFGVGATRRDEAETLALEPALRPGFAGSWHFEGDCHLRPDRLLAGMRLELEARGVEFIEGSEVEGFAVEGRAIRAAETADGPVEADRFLVATGAWTPLLQRHLGLRIPIEPGKGYSITTEAPGRMPTHPIIFEDSHVAVTPMGERWRIGSTMEFAGYDETISPRRLKLLTDAAEAHLVEPMGGAVRETWYGWRPMVWDGKPIIGPSPNHSNAWIAAGHSMIGLSLATGTGRLVAELMSGDEPHVDPAGFAAERFR